ncbi:MAG: hypothetical protein NUW23_02770 [Firmicutes bacterium]|jgi:hypothetical protein|nr:hypothetical protein [Bacillota bacterium]
MTFPRHCARLAAVALVVALVAILTSGCFPFGTEVTLFYETFTNPDPSWDDGWDGTASWGVVDGIWDPYYQMSVSNDHRSVVAPIPVGPLDSYTVSADVARIAGSNIAYGIAFAIQGETSAWQSAQFYLFVVNPGNQTWELREWDEGWTHLKNGGSIYINPGGASNNLKVSRSLAGGIKIYANGKQLTSITDFSFTGNRYLALYIETVSTTSATVKFDNVLVTGTNLKVAKFSAGALPPAGAGPAPVPESKLEILPE